MEAACFSEHLTTYLNYTVRCYNPQDCNNDHDRSETLRNYRSATLKCVASGRKEDAEK
jgi:hypothetical protein